MMPPSAVFFDFDGTLVESNDIKRAAFYSVTKHIPKTREFISALFETNQNLSRYDVFEKVAAEFVPSSERDSECRRFLQTYSLITIARVSKASEIAGASRLLMTLKGKSLLVFVCSATPQQDLCSIIQIRGWSELFTAIRGAPKSKVVNIKDLCLEHRLKREDCCVVGDGLIDFDAAKQCRMQFIKVGRAPKSSNAQNFFVAEDVNAIHEMFYPGDLDN
jgi:phosphoglycolate phosphatase